MNKRIDEQISIELLGAEHTRDLFSLADTNREHLQMWLPWVDLTQSIEDTLVFIQSTRQQYEDGGGPVYALIYNGAICGVNGFHKIDKLNRSATLGYWLAESFTGKGIITTSTRALLEIGFNNYALHKISIHCAEHNTKSRAVPERLGFKYEATLRDCGLLNQGYVDHAIYSMLESEFIASPGEPAF